MWWVVALMGCGAVGEDREVLPASAAGPAAGRLDLRPVWLERMTPGSAVKLDVMNPRNAPIHVFRSLTGAAPDATCQPGTQRCVDLVGGVPWVLGAQAPYTVWLNLPANAPVGTPLFLQVLQPVGAGGWRSDVVADRVRAPCVADALEPNEGRNPPAELTPGQRVTGLRWCDEGDAYAADVPAGSELEVTVHFGAFGAELSLPTSPMLPAVRTTSSVSRTYAPDAQGRVTFAVGRAFGAVMRALTDHDGIAYEIETRLVPAPVPAPCAEDPAEGGPHALAPGVAVSGVVCPAPGSREDRADLVGAGPGAYEITLTWDPAGPTPSLGVNGLRDENTQGRRLNVVPGVEPGVSTLRFVTDVDPLRIEVGHPYGAADVPIAYTLQVDRIPGAWCAAGSGCVYEAHDPCVVDGAEPDDDTSQAVVLGLGAPAVARTACPGDLDWFAVDVGSAGVIDVEVDADSGPLELVLADAGGLRSYVTLDSASGDRLNARGTTRVALPAPSAGRWWVGVHDRGLGVSLYGEDQGFTEEHGTDRGTAYTIAASFRSPVCADAWEPDAVAPTLVPGVALTRSLCGSADVDRVRVWATAGQRIAVRVDGTALQSVRGRLFGPAGEAVRTSPWRGADATQLALTAIAPADGWQVWELAGFAGAAVLTPEEAVDYTIEGWAGAP